MTDIVGYPLAPQQELLHRSLGESPAAHVSGVIRIAGAIDEAGVRRAVEQLVARHEILRTRFVTQSGRTSLLQVVDSNATADLSIEDLTSLGAAEQTARIAAVGGELAVSRNLEKGPAFRARLLTCSAQTHVLVISLPALCGDVEAMQVLARELGALYSAAALDADPVQYADYAEWQREELRSTATETEAARAHWTAVLQQSKAPALLAAGDRQASAPLNYRVVSGAIDAGTWTAVQATARTAGVSAEKVCLAAWQTLLARVSVNSVVETRVVSRGQTAGELADAVGLYAKALPVQVTVEPSDAFADVVARSARALDETLSAATYWPCEMRAQIEVDFEWDARSTAAGAGSWQLEECHAQVARFDVKLSCAVRPDGLHTALWYDETVLSPAEAARLSTLYRGLLTAAAREPQTAVGSLNIASADLAPAQASGQGSAAPDLRMHEWIAQQAARTPSHTAVVGADETLTYAALEARAGRIAAWLQSQGVARGAVVGLVGERSAALMAAVVGVWKAGAAFVPMLPDQPSARVMEQLVETAAAAVIVTEESGRGAIAGYDGPVLCLAGAALPDRAGVDAGVTSDDPAYVLYTSGSTGRPKGVIVRHRNLVAYSASIVEALAGIAGPGVKWATVSALTADLGHTCIFPALASGGAVHMVPQAAILDGALLGDYMSAHAIDVLKITPSHLSAVLTDTGAALPRRALVFGGEALPWSLVATVRARGACSVWNHYGPTETTVGALIYPVPEAPLATRTVPIGRPLGRSEIAVVDDRGAVVPVGVAGELWIGGPGVAAGYVAQPERTAERFVAPTWAPGSMWYRTGDRVWMSAAGAVEFLGRVDDQVKIRGYRVEPGEVEHVLRAVPGVHEAAVVAVGEPGDMRLVGFVAAGSDISDEVIRTALLARLPAYMVPAQLVPLRALPRLGNGKIDRRALAAVDLSQPVVPDSAGPRNPVEATLHEIWLALLNRPALSIDDHFFEMGGHSLLATRLVARVRKAFDVQLPLRVIFEHPTIRSLAALVEARLQERSPSADELITDAEGLTESEIQALLDHLDTK